MFIAFCFTIAQLHPVWDNPSLMVEVEGILHFMSVVVVYIIIIILLLHIIIIIRRLIIEVNRRCYNIIQFPLRFFS